MALGASLTDIWDRCVALRRTVSGTGTTRPTYEDSIGEPLSDIAGYRRWTLIGAGLQIWEKGPQDLRLRIREVICENEGTIYKGERICATATTIHCWMLGHNTESALPTVVISHTKRLILKRTMRVISQHGLLKEYGFGLKGCPSCDLKLLYGVPTGQLTIPAPSQGPPFSLYGAEVSVENIGRKATLGGVLVLDGGYYGVTVAHVFAEKDWPAEQKALPDTECILYDSDWAEDTSEDDGDGEEDRDSDFEASAAPSAPFPLDCSDESPSHVSTMEKEQSSGSLRMQNYKLHCLSSQDSSCNMSFPQFDGVDWAIMRITNPDYHGMNGVIIGKSAYRWLYVRQLSDSPPRNSIIVATRKGAVKGIGTGSATSIKVRGDDCLRNVWSIQPEEALGVYVSYLIPAIISATSFVSMQNLPDTRLSNNVMAFANQVVFRTRRFRLMGRRCRVWQPLRNSRR